MARAAIITKTLKDIKKPAGAKKLVVYSAIFNYSLQFATVSISVVQYSAHESISSSALDCSLPINSKVANIIQLDTPVEIKPDTVRIELCIVETMNQQQFEAKLSYDWTS